AEIANFPSKHVVITGGEPSLYNLNSFIQKLQSLSYYVAIETNGLHPENIKSSDWITYSPKGFPKGGFADFWSELKIVVNKKANIKKLLEYTQNKNFPVYIQPESFQDELNLENVKFCVELVKQYPHLRLSVQLHKALEER
ncbi:MAG: 7-carboxy-7-deazaguanine synthase, partial [bacterium]